MTTETLTTPTDCILRVTGMYGRGERSETLTCSKFEFRQHLELGDDDPDLIRVFALAPGQETLVVGHLGGPFKIRCLTMDEAMAELDREATA